MARESAARLAEREAARETLRAMLPPGSVVTVLQRHVARSGMTRWLDLYATVDGTVERITETAALAMGDRTYYRDGSGWTLKVSGCGMDMHFHTVYGLSRSLYRDGVPCTGVDAGPGRCPSNDHNNDYGTFAREYDAEHDADHSSRVDDAERTAYVAARQAWITKKLEQSYALSRVHSDGGYALTPYALSRVHSDGGYALTHRSL